MQILRTVSDTSPPDYGIAQAQAVLFFIIIAVITLTQVRITKKRELEA
jgi:raffinose/stachyose/melibiose transport system permease protein